MSSKALPTNDVAALLNREMLALKIRGRWPVNRTELDQWIDAQPRGGDGGGCGE